MTKPHIQTLSEQAPLKAPVIEKGFAGRQIRAFYYFVTADGGVRMEHGTDDRIAPPRVSFPLSYPLWANGVRSFEDTDPSNTDAVPIRRYALAREEYLKDGITKVYTYQEIQ